jgi:hypothetical protein
MMPCMLIIGLWAFGARAALPVGTVIGGIASAKPLQMVGPRPQLRYDGVSRAADPVKECAELDADYNKGIRPLVVWDSPECQEWSA